VINLLYGVGLSRFPSMDEVEAFTVGPVASMCQHQQSCRKATYNSANDCIAWLALLEGFGQGARLPVYGTDWERWPLKCETFNRLY
jgi:hypothetical protein